MTIQRYGWGLGETPYSPNRLIPDPSGEWVRYADIPKPAPWLEQPTEAGWWWLKEPNREIAATQIGRTPSGWHFDGVCFTEIPATVGLWQRIPDAVPPGEGGQA